MRIGLVGYYGWGNYGDELFFQVFQEWFNDHELVLFHDPLKGKFLPNSDELIDSVDAIIIGGGDLLIPWYKSWLYWDIRFLKKPVFVFSVGVPTWGKSDPIVLNHFKRFLAHPNVKMISLRDEESLLWVKNNLDIDKELTFSPDMALALQFPQRKVESRYIGLVLRKQKSYVAENLLHLADTISEMGYSLKLIQLGTGKILNDDYEVFQHIRFKNYQVVVRDSISKLSAEIASCAYFVSMKFHGCIGAYKCGVPFIALSHADKFVNFMKQTGNERYLSTWSDLDLSEKFERLVYEGMDFSQRLKLVSEAKAGLERLRAEFH